MVHRFNSMWSDSLRAQEFPYSEYAIKSLGGVLWAGPLLTTLESRGGVKAANSEMLFEVRFALELHRARAEADYEYATGIGESKVDFHLKGDQEWLIEIVSLRESEVLKNATRESDGWYERLMLPSSAGDRNSLPAEMIRAQRQIGDKVFDNRKARATKFPIPTSDGPMQVIIADMRGYCGDDPVGSEYDFRPEYLQIAYGINGLSKDKISADPALVRFWNYQPVKGLFEKSNPTKSTKLVQERIHFVGFVYERRYGEGEISQALFMCANLELFLSDRAEARRVYETFPLKPSRCLTTI